MWPLAKLTHRVTLKLKEISKWTAREQIVYLAKGVV